MHYSGKIYEVNSYYGIINFKEKKIFDEEELIIERKIPFFVKDLTKFNIGDEVTFEISTQVLKAKQNQVKVRSQEIQYAINLIKTQSSRLTQSYSAQNDFFELLNNKLAPSPNINDENSMKNFLKNNNLRYSVINEMAVLIELFETKIQIEELQNIINYDVKIKEFILRWVLFVEDELKKQLEKNFEINSFDIEDVINKINESNDKKAKRLIKTSLKRIQKNYLLRNADWRLKFIVTNDDEIPKLKYAPLDMIMDEFTVGDLMVFINFMKSEYPLFINDANDWNKLFDYLSELKLIRNIAAHGNSFLSAVLDKKNNPNYLLEYNAQSFGDDSYYLDKSKDYRIFNLVRSSIKLVLKGNTKAPQQYAVKWTQKLLNNHVLRSFFYFYFMVCYLTKDTDDIFRFKNDLREIFGDYPKKVDFDKVIMSLIMDSEGKEKNKKNLLNFLIPQAINMFDYVKQNGYEYKRENRDTVYKVHYRNKIVKIDLSNNARWHLDMLRDIAKKSNSEDLNKEVNEKFGMFFSEKTNARETLSNMLDANLELNSDQRVISILLKLEGFQDIKVLFLDILDVFSNALN